MKLSTCNKELDQILFSKPNKILIYGEAATGKTNFLLNIIKCSTSLLSPTDALFYISTEGSIFIQRALKLKLLGKNVFFSTAIDQQHLLSLVLEVLKSIDLYNPICLFIDSINSHYRVESITSEGINNFIAILTILDLLNKNNVYVLSTAQVKFGETDISGYEYLYPWANIILKISRESGPYRTLKFHKPNITGVIRFSISFNGIQWIHSQR